MWYAFISRIWISYFFCSVSMNICIGHLENILFFPPNFKLNPFNKYFPLLLIGCERIRLQTVTQPAEQTDESNLFLLKLKRVVMTRCLSETLFLGWMIKMEAN